MDQRVGTGLLEHIPETLISNVHPHEFTSHRLTRRNDVDPDHPVNPGLIHQLRSSLAAEVPGNSGYYRDDTHGLLLIAALDPGSTQQLAVLLLGHPLATLFDHRAHVLPLLPQYPANTGDMLLDSRDDQP